MKKREYQVAHTVHLKADEQTFFMLNELKAQYAYRNNGTKLLIELITNEYNRVFNSNTDEK